MGILLSKFKPKKPYSEVLEELEKEINTLEVRRKHLYNTHRNIVEQFLTSSLAIYFVVVILYYNLFYPENLRSKLLAYIPIVVSPLLIAMMKKIISWFFRLKLMRTDNHIDILENQKVKILDFIIKTETYSEAKKYFDKYAPRHTKVLGFPIKLESSEKIVSRKNVASNTSKVPSRSSFVPEVSENSQESSTTSSQRIVFDKLVDYLGDGPSNRYALICKNCARHNGMALKDDFQYITFRCCYCYCLNSSKKSRLPTANLAYDDNTSKHEIDEVLEDKSKETEVLYSKLYNAVSESESKIVHTMQ